MTKHIVPMMMKSGKGGSIVNIASVSATIAQPRFAPYAMSKAAVRQLTRNSAMDLGKFNIRYDASLVCLFFVMPPALKLQSFKYARAQSVLQIDSKVCARHEMKKL